MPYQRVIYFHGNTDQLEMSPVLIFSKVYAQQQCEESDCYTSESCIKKS